MASASSPLQIEDDDDEFDWEAAVQEIDVACMATICENPTSTSTSNFVPSYSCEQEMGLNPAQEMRKKGNFDVRSNPVSSTRQTTLDRFIGVSSSDSRKLVGKVECSNGLLGNNLNGVGIGDKNGGGVADCEDIEMLNPFVKIDPEAAKSWIYPVNVPRRDYQFSITETALYANTLVVLPTGLGKTLIAAVVMYNFFRWFPEGKIVFAAPSRPLVIQQIEACHKIVGIPQEWTIDLTGQTNPTRRAEFWKCKRVFFVTPQVLEKDIQSGSCLVKHLVCLVIDEAHHATGNYSYCVAVRELMDARVQLRILALTATPGSKQQTIQHVIDNLQISKLEYRNESDPDVRKYVNDKKIELIQVAMGAEADKIDDLLSEVARPYISRLSNFGLLQKRDFRTMSPCDFLSSRRNFHEKWPVSRPHTNHGEIEGVYGALMSLCYVRKLLSSYGINPAFGALDENLKQGSFARILGRNDDLLKAKLLMQQYIAHGDLSPKLTKMLEVLIDHFKVNEPNNSRVIIFSSFRGSIRYILDTLTNIGDIVKATEFIGQSSVKSKGQSQKVQQEVLQKFRTGGYNVIVASCIGEEGLDIMEVDLVVCFDANVSPLRMVQRMGRTGRKHKGRVVVLACEGSELRGYMRKKASSNTIKKHMINGGMNSFNYHLSPRMVPHAFKPEVQLVEVSIEEYVPRGKKPKASDPVPVPAYTNKLTDAEMDILAKYFATTRQTTRRPSLIAFPHFQAFPSPINKVPHSSRTGMLIDTMQYLQGLTYSRESKASPEDEDSSDPCLRVVAEEHHHTLIEDSERSNDPYEDKLKIEVEGMDIELEEIAEDDIEDFHKPKTCLHTFIFDSEFVSVDNAGNVLVLSLPQLPLESMSQRIEGSNMTSAYHLINNNNDREENLVEGEGDPSWHPRSPEVAHESYICNPDVENGKSFSGEEEVPHTPVSSRKVSDLRGQDHNVMHDKMLMPLAHELSSDFIDLELSPRLTNFIKSGIVPESPVHNSGTCNGDGGHFSGPLVSSPIVQTEFLINTLGKMDVSCTSDKENQSPEVKCIDNSLETCSSPIPVAKEMQTPLAKLSNKSCSEEWLLDSGVKPETVEQQCKLRRLRKLRDLNRKNSPESREQTGPSRKLRTSRMNGHHTSTKLVKGTKKQAKDAAIFIDEEAEVSSEDMASDNEEDELDNSSYEDSFIDDGTNPTSASTQPGVSRPDMIAIYRRSLLTQSPFQTLPNFASKYSPDSVVQSSRIDESRSSSGAKRDDTPQNGFLSTARNSQFPSDGIPTETVESNLESRKRKLSFYQSHSVPMINLDKEFSLFPESARENSSMQVHAERIEEIGDVFDDDQFYEGIDLDAVEEEATKLLRKKTECSTQKEAALSEPVQQSVEILESPSFDLGF